MIELGARIASPYDETVRQGRSRTGQSHALLSAWIAAATALAVPCLPVAAAPAQKKRQARPTPKRDPIADLIGALALNSAAPGQDLHAACERSNFQALAWGLDGIKDRITIEKSEFETEAEFAERRGKLEDALNQVGQVVVCQPLDDNEDAPFAYDAERELFRGTFATRQNVWRDVKRTGSYVSRTRMGVRATVRSSVQIEYDVDMAAALRRATPPCLKSTYSGYSYEVPVPRAEAPGVKSSGYLVFMGRLASPFYGSSDSAGSPTLDDPRDVYERTMTVHFAPAAVAVVGPAGPKIWECRLTGD